LPRFSPSHHPFRKGRSERFAVRGDDAALNARTGRNNPVDWRFDERETADYAWDTFQKAGLLGRTQIRVHYTPYKEGTDEEYPDPEE
jgi:hypothetical protein